MKTEAYERNGVFYGPRTTPQPKGGPSEESEHLRVVAALREAGVYFVHVPNGGARGRRAGAMCARLGARRGFPDLLILDTVSRLTAGVALELKRDARGSGPSKEQVGELEALAARGWIATVQWGADEALAFLRRCGYVV